MKTFFSALILALFLGGCGLDKTRLNHVILVWFNEEVTPAQIAQIETKTGELSAIGELKFVTTGRAVQSDRPIVDDSFDLGVIMQFDSKEAMERYLEDPRHKAFVAEYLKGKVKKLVVYDF